MKKRLKECKKIPRKSLDMTKAALDVSTLALPTTVTRDEAEQDVHAKEINVHWHEQGIPSHVGHEIEHLYKNFFSSYDKIKGLNEDDGTCAFVVRENGIATAIFLFRNEGKRVHVLNEFIGIGNDVIGRFTQSVFVRYPMANVVSFRAIQPDVRRLPFPYQRYNCIEDIVLSLPASIDEYHKLLGKNMRKNIRTHLDRIRLRFPSFSFAIYGSEEADEGHIRSIIRFNRERTLGKSKMPGIDETETERIVHLVKSCGMVAVVTIEGEICAGKLFFQTGPNYFSLLNAHSPQFNEYRLGTLCNYLSICECIRRGGKEFHFLWGREEFKYRFGGEQRDFDELVIYRSPLHMALNGKLVLKTALEGRKRQARLWLLDPERKDHAAVKFARKTLRHLRGIR